MLWNKKKFYVFVICVFAINGFAFSEEDFEYNAKSKRDPFIPLVSEGSRYVSDAYGIRSIKDIRLEGIVWDGVNDSLVIINGEIFREGQEVGPVKILEIEEESVSFDVDGEEVIIELTED